MKKIIFDELRRSAWVYLLIAVIFLLIFSLFPRREMQQIHRASGMIVYSLLFCGPLLLSFRLQRGFARVVLSMPVSKAEAGAACAFFSIVAPMIFFCVITVAFICVQFARQIPAAIAPANLFLLAVSALAYVGTAHFVLTLMPAHSELGFRHNLKGILPGALWGLCIGGGAAVGNNLFSHLENFQLRHYLAIAAGLIMTILGFLRSANMLSTRALPASIPDNSSTTHKTGAPHTGSTGIPFLLGTSFRMAVQFFAIFLAVILGISFLNRHSFSVDRLESAAEQLWPMMLFLLLPSLQWFAGIRHWRALPISNWKLVATIAAIFAIPALLVIIAQISISLIVQNTISPNLLTKALAWLGVSILVPGVVLRSGNIKSISILFILLMPLAIIFGGYLSSSLWTSLSTFLVLGGSGLILIHLSLTRYTSTYKLSFFTRP